MAKTNAQQSEERMRQNKWKQSYYRKKDRPASLQQLLVHWASENKTIREGPINVEKKRLGKDRKKEKDNNNNIIHALLGAVRK